MWPGSSAATRTNPSPANLAALQDRAQKHARSLRHAAGGGEPAGGRRPSLFVAVDRSLRHALRRPHRRAALVRHRPLPRLRRCTGQGAAGNPADHRAQGSGVRHPGPHLPPVADHRHRPAHGHRDPLHPQPGAGDRAPRRRRRRLRARAGRELPPSRRARGAPGRPGLPVHEGPHRAPRRAADQPAGRRLPRPSHAADPAEARTGPCRAGRARRGHEARPRRHGADDRRVPRLRPGRGRRSRRHRAAPAPAAGDRPGRGPGRGGSDGGARRTTSASRPGPGRSNAPSPTW